MFTSIDKALVAAIMGVLFIVQTYTGLSMAWVTPGADAPKEAAGACAPASRNEKAASRPIPIQRGPKAKVGLMKTNA